MNPEIRFSELYSIIEETATIIESRPELKPQFEKNIKEYKTLLKQRYEESIDEEAEEGSFYYYNGCHGYLEVECSPYEDIPESVKDFVLEKKKSVSFIVYKKTTVFDTINVGNFTLNASTAFFVNPGEYNKYLKIEYSWNETEGNIKVNIYVYNRGNPILITDNEGIPNIRLEYHTKDFNMGYFPLLQGSSDNFFCVSKTKFTGGGVFQGSYVFPKLIADFEYVEKDKRGNYFSSSLFSMEESLLDRCFTDLLDFYKGSDREEEFKEDIEINIFNSSCLFCDKKVSKDIIKKYPQWAEIMKEEIDIYYEDNPLVRQSKKRKIFSGLRKKKKSKKVKRSSKKKKSKKVKRSSKKKKSKKVKRSSKRKDPN